MGLIEGDGELFWVCDHLSSLSVRAASEIPAGWQYEGYLRLSLINPTIPLEPPFSVVARETPNVGDGEPSDGLVSIEIANHPESEPRFLSLMGTWVYVEAPLNPLTLTGYADGVGNVGLTGAVEVRG